VLGPGVANIGQDHLRRVVLREHDVPGGDNVGLIAHTVEYCLAVGCDVLLEGILLEAHYGQMLRELLGSHAGPSHVFYLDVPLDETLRRHEGRPLRSEVPAEKLREWFVPDDLLGWPGEVVLDATAGLATVLAGVLAHLGPVSQRPPRARDAVRFL
jgi:hypothetical protein